MVGLSWNLTLENILKNQSKSDEAKTLQSEISQNVKLLLKNLTPCKNLNWKLCVLEKRKKSKIHLFHGIRWTKTCFLIAKDFFKNWHVKDFWIQIPTRCIFSIQNLTCWSFLKNETHCVVLSLNSKLDLLNFFLFQNLTLCKTIISKFDFQPVDELLIWICVL